MKEVLAIVALAGLVMAAAIVGCKKEDKVELPALTTLSVNEISYTSAKSGGSITKDGGAEITIKGLVWSDQNNPTLEKNIGINSQGNGSGAFSADLSGLNPNHSYYVRAFATNSKGTAYGNQQTFKTLPISEADVLTGQVSNITFTSATCSGNIKSDGGTIVVSRGLCWNTSELPTVDNFKIVLGSGTGEFSGNLEGLTAATHYFVRAYATNSQGTAYGNQQTFFTLGAPFPILSTKEVISITATSASTGGNVTSDNGYAVSARGVCWNTQPNPTTTNYKTSNGSGVGEFISNITSLSPNTTYYLRAYATNTKGTGYGNELIFSTPISFAPVVSTSDVSNITYTSATSGGTVSTDNGFQVTARGICFGLQPNPTLANSFTNDGSGVGHYTSYLTGLTQNNTYYIRAYATNSQGTAFGNEITFNTNQVITPSIKTNEVSNVYESIATCGGNVTFEGGSPVITRGVCWNTSPFPTTSNFKTSNGSGTGSFQSQLTGLSGSTTYYLRAYAINSAGTSYGNQEIFTTLQYFLPTVTTLSITPIYATTASGGGAVVSDGDTAVTSRGVCWSTSANPTIYNSTTIDGTGTGQFTSIILNLTVGATYYIRAYATNVKGTAYGNQYQFTTLNPCFPLTSITDSDGNSYNLVAIGTKCWMKENLKTTKYRNGTSIPNVTNNYSWSTLTTGAYTWYNNNMSWKNSYGALYNWFAIDNINQLCPAGWHIPTATEWNELIDYSYSLGFTVNGPNGFGNAHRSCRQKNSPIGGNCNTSTHPRWNSHNTNHGFDYFGFAGFPGEYRLYNGGMGGSEPGNGGYWWSYTQTGIQTAKMYSIVYDLFGSGIHSGIGDQNKNSGLSVRCIKD